MLPDQMGVYEQSLGTFISEPNTPEDNIEIQKLLPLFHVNHRDYSEGIKLVTSGQVKTKRSVWFVRNRLLDAVKAFFDTVDGTKMIDMKDTYRKLAKQSYDALKSEAFKAKLTEQKLTLTKDIDSALEETYSAALKLDKQ